MTPAPQQSILERRLRADGATWHPPLIRQQVTSTSDAIRQLADQTPRLHGGWLLATANEQTAGRGRMGHAWFSPPGRALYLSMGVELTLPAPVWPRASIVVGAAVAKVIERKTGVSAVLKWPNDLLVLDGSHWRKVGGILCERHERPGAGKAVWIVGIGVNLSVEKTEFPAFLQDHVGSLAWWADVPPLQEFAADVAIGTRIAITRWELRGGAIDVDAVMERLAFVGSRVRWDLGDGGAPGGGELRAIAPDGSLHIAADDGSLRSVQPLQLLSADCAPPWRAPPRLDR